MIDLLLKIVDYYTTHLSNTLPAYADYAIFYGWLAGASAVTAIITLVAVLLRREAGKGAAVAVGQHMLVWGSPFLLQAALDLWGQG